jgi:hypothetical protein
MRNIEPVIYRKGGENQTAKFLDAKIVYDDLQSNCTFYWAVKSETYISGSLIEVSGSLVEETSGSFIPGLMLDEGNLTMGNSEYTNWDGSNDYAYNYIASNQNLILIPDTASLEG